MSITKWPMNNRLLTFGLAGVNLVAVSGILLLPSATGASQRDTVFLSVLVVSVQAGQAVVVQVGKAFPNKAYFTTFLALGVLLASAVYEDVPGALSDFAVPTGLGLAGVLFGTCVGAVAQVELAKGSAFTYQVVLLLRSLIWAGVVGICLLFFDVGVLYASLGAWILIALLSIRRTPVSDTKMNLTLTILLGAAAGLLYRNDVSLARAAAFGASFHIWNIALVVYTISQSLLGFVVVNEIFSRRALVLAKLTTRRRYAIKLIVIVSLPVFTVVGIVVQSAFGSNVISVVVQTVVLVLAGSVVAAQASLAHINSSSRAVYLAGAIGFGALVGSYALGVAPAVGLLIELLFSGLVVALGTRGIRGGVSSEPNSPSL
jgi:hypothetical protein